MDLEALIERLHLECPALKLPGEVLLLPGEFLNPLAKRGDLLITFQSALDNLLQISLGRSQALFRLVECSPYLDETLPGSRDLLLEKLDIISVPCNPALLHLGLILHIIDSLALLLDLYFQPVGEKEKIPAGTGKQHKGKSPGIFKSLHFYLYLPCFCRLPRQGTLEEKLPGAGSNWTNRSRSSTAALPWYSLPAPLPPATWLRDITASPFLAIPPNISSDFEVQIYREEKGRILFDPVVIAVVRNLLEKNFELCLGLPP